MRLSQLVLLALFISAFAFPVSVAQAQSDVDPDKLKAAADEYDAGRRAYKQGDYARAAAHFENAFRDAPNAAPLRMAIRARKEAGDLARAATLCARAQALYPDDRETMQVTQSVLRETSSKLQKVTVRCEPACTVGLDGRLVQEDSAAVHLFYAAAGEHEVRAGWGRSRSVSKAITATEGEAMTLQLEAPAEPEPVAPKPAVLTPPEGNRGPEGDSGATADSSSGLSPVFFWVGTGVTAVLGGVTVWSGLDTRSNPGPDNVRAACVGLGDSCPEYQDGLSKERRTNVLIGATAGAAVVTGVVGLFFTDWSGGNSNTTTVQVAPSVSSDATVSFSAFGQF